LIRSMRHRLEAVIAVRGNTTLYKIVNILLFFYRQYTAKSLTDFFPSPNCEKTYQ
ncbi:hypothetical protein B9Z19DRAFT_964596, partial [Tuber borchii]